MTTATTPLVFTKTDRLISNTSAHLTYHRRTDEEKKAIHWGQRKLLLSEIEFLTLFWNPKEVPKPTIVYAGAASGDHIPLLSLMFPAVDFHLYDPSRFSIKETPKIHIYQQLFLDEDAKKWSDRKDVFLISDIRSADLKTSEFPTEENIKFDMDLQQKWVEIINPVAALLKFRPPYANPGQPSSIEYLQGYVFLQVWPGQTSTETRLVPIRNEKGQYYKVLWDTLEFEQKLFYHNVTTREKNVYLNLFTDKAEPLDPPELLNDYDSTSEAYILQQYFLKMQKKTEGVTATCKNVLGLSRTITKALNKGRPLVTGRTLEVLRNAPVKSTNLRARTQKDHNKLRKKVSEE